MIIGINLYDMAKIIAGLVVLGIVLAIFSAPVQAIIYVIDSFGHLADNGMGWLQYPAWLLLAVAIVFLVRRKWLAGGATVATLIALSAWVGFTSADMRGDTVAFGSERNVQWAAALAGEPRSVSMAWIEPEEIQTLRRDTDVSCCTSEFVLKEEGSYPKDTGTAMRVGKYNLSRTGTLATSSFLTDYIEVVNDGAGDWLAFANRCIAAYRRDMEAYARENGKAAVDRLSRENARKFPRPDHCNTVEGVEEAYSLDLAARMVEVIEADGGNAASLLKTSGLDAACAAHDRCAAFEQNFALDVK
ncbi:hypothetical protein [Stappia sp. ES.058]|uniref:hypothetical protein n=1 Tax=Stappia sp. ES.058 TaxID=1881061 RepID=UPI00087D32E5|nr:hypothetical protein [Stappia sp. ES.058]SDU20556.1 hypothetical protein SAMN05428979_2269 [Stappia sp. ES.058]